MRCPPTHLRRFPQGTPRRDCKPAGKVNRITGVDDRGADRMSDQTNRHPEMSSTDMNPTPSNPGHWPGSTHGMPAPPGWSQPALGTVRRSATQPAPPSPVGWAPRPDQPAPKKPSKWVPVLVALALVGTLVARAVTAISMANAASGGQPVTATASGIVDVTTFGKEIGAPTSQLTPMGAGTGMALTCARAVLTHTHL